MAGTLRGGGAMLGAGMVAAAIGAAAIVYFAAPAVVSVGAFGPPGSSPSPSPSFVNGGGVPVGESDAVPAAEPTGDGGVVPFITSAVFTDDGLGVIVYSFVPGLGKDGGTCSASVVGMPELAASGPAVLEVADTVCPPLTIALGTTADTDLEVIVDYASDTVTGVSERTAVVEP